MLVHMCAGNRDIVGYGFNGNPVYIDREEWPAPAVRFKENTAEVQALQAKEKGDWKAMTLEEKKGCKLSTIGPILEGCFLHNIVVG